MTTLTLTAKETEMLVAVMSEMGEIPSTVSFLSLFPLWHRILCVESSLGSFCCCARLCSYHVDSLASDAT